MRSRDRDAPVTHDGLIFRAYGYDHPPGSCFCDLEYAPESLYSTDDPRALREGQKERYYKFYFDGGLRFASDRVPPYRIRHRPLRTEMVGVTEEQISHLVRPEARLQDLLDGETDPLIEACIEVLDLVISNSSLKLRDFGVFGSLAHGFHHPRYSDIDLIIYGSKELRELREVLTSIFAVGPLRNEFEEWTTLDPPTHWNFTHLTKGEYGDNQRRKKIYAIHSSKSLGRDVKVEFEPVRKWSEVKNEYVDTSRIVNMGRVESTGEVITGEEGGFMPSMYKVRLDRIDARVDPGDIERVVSYVEEFRLQAFKGERVLIRGNLERVEAKGGGFHQITLSYGEDYFDQVIRPIGSSG